MKISLIVPSVGRPEDLRRALASARRCAPSLDEVVVVHRETDTATRRVAEEFGANAVVTTVPGLAQAMRAGAEAATSDVVAFTDDDAELLPGWLEAIRGAYEAGGNRVAGVGGPDRQPGGGDASDVADSRVGSVSRTGRLKGGHHRASGEARCVSHLKGVNMSFRRDLFLAVPVYALIVGEGAQNRNEVIISFPLVKKGFSLVFEPRAEVRHTPAPRAEGDARVADASKCFETAHNEALAFWLSRHPLRLVNSLMLMSIGYGHAPGALRLARGATLPQVRSTIAGVAKGMRLGRASARRTLDQIPREGAS